MITAVLFQERLTFQADKDLLRAVRGSKGFPNLSKASRLRCETASSLNVRTGVASWLITNSVNSTYSSISNHNPALFKSFPVSCSNVSVHCDGYRFVHPSALCF